MSEEQHKRSKIRVEEQNCRMEMVGSSSSASAALKSDTFLVQFQFQTSPFAHAPKQSHYRTIPSLSISLNPPRNLNFFASSSMMFCLRHNCTASATRRTTNASHISTIRAQTQSSISSGTSRWLPLTNLISCYC